MDFRLSDDQRALREGVRDLVAGRFPRERLRAAVDAYEAAGDGPALDRGLWRELAGAGFFSLLLAEADGGAGLGLPEAVLVLEEAGRALLPGPLVAGVLLAGTVPGAATGERVAGMCDAASLPALWEHPADCDEVIVLGAHAARRCTPEELRPVAVRSVDPLTPLARLLDVPPGEPCAVDVDRLRREAALLTAAQQLGGAQRTLEAAVAYARQREQFGAPIGSFQAVQHLCAEMLVRVEIARSAVYAASVTVDPVEVVGAKLLADEAAVGNARDCLQVHGGMGFTWEADVHLALKRAWLLAERGQPAAAGAEVLAEALADGHIAL
ncbi:acyl-CoA dehydrogenase [Streptomyces sp. Ru73]|uniref:acyl-CoA dehydrogenase family protein n=1 Tax=Streptomyces sp. Ru73 TaxID=2080748 RepID=UPI000CDD7F82|nr:acyl-CoA dehydrogenase family protein [Streptomyces sp. Ru73]POX37134.1 acyl-CoA dehydrogenase [Streptomyces sp. Ru73]